MGISIAYDEDEVFAELDKKYEPLITFNEFNIGARGVNEAFEVTFTGMFLDFISDVEISDSQQISIISKSFNQVIISITTNSIVQENTITFNYPTGSRDFTFNTANIQSIVPSPTGTGESLWTQPTPLPANNEVTLTLGKFEAEQDNGEGWNNHAYYGNFQGSFTKITHEFTTKNDTNAFCYIKFNNTNTVGTGGNPRIYISSATNLQVFSSTGTQISNTQIVADDTIRVEFTSTTMSVFVNGVLIVTNTGNYNLAMQNSYVTFTSFRFTILENIITRKFE